MKDISNINEISSLLPDFMGFIFYPGSLRYVGIDPDPELFDNVPPAIKKVAVFVDEKPERMMNITNRYRIDMVQLHGSESPDTCLDLKNRGRTVIKFFPGNQAGNYKLLQSFEEVTDFFLFDTPTKTHGGSGKQFDWTELQKFQSEKEFFLSGGIGPVDVEKVKELKLKNLYALDVNSKIEMRPGIKNPYLAAELIEKVRNE